MLHLLKENEENRRVNKLQYILGCILLLLSSYLLIRISFNGMVLQALAWYIDLPSLLFLAVPCTALSLIAGVRGRREIVSFLKKILLPVCMVVTLVSAVIILANAREHIEALGPNLAVCLLTPLYTTILYLVLILYERRLEG